MRLFQSLSSILVLFGVGSIILARIRNASASKILLIKGSKLPVIDVVLVLFNIDFIHINCLLSNFLIRVEALLKSLVKRLHFYAEYRSFGLIAIFVNSRRQLFV